MTHHTNKPLNQKESDRLIKRVKQLLISDPGMSYNEMATVLNSENYVSIRGLPITALNLRQIIWKLRHNEKSWYNLSARRANLNMQEVAA